MEATQTNFMQAIWEVECEACGYKGDNFEFMSHEITDQSEFGMTLLCVEKCPKCGNIKKPDVETPGVLG